MVLDANTYSITNLRLFQLNDSFRKQKETCLYISTENLTI